MNNIRTISILIFCLAIQFSGFAQDQIKILDSSSKILGRFKTQLYQINDGDQKQLRGTSPDINASGDEQELILRLDDLRWFDDVNKSETVTVNRSDIKISDYQNLRISSSKNSFEIAAGDRSSADINFKVYENGDYSLSIPFNAAGEQSRFVQNFSVDGLTKQEPVGKPIGQIADIKKAWKVTDKRDPEAVEAFITKYKDNQLAKDEGLLVIADRTLKRISSNPSVVDQEEDQGERDVFIETKTIEIGPHLLSKKGGNIYSLDLSGLDEIDIKLSNEDDLVLYNNGGNLYEIEVKGNDEYKITVTDIKSKTEHIFNLNNELSAQLESRDKDFVFVINGGVEPFTVEFLKPDETTATVEARFDNLKPDVANQLIITNEMLRSSGMDGLYTIALLRDMTTAKQLEYPIDLFVKPKSGSGKLILLVLLGIIFAGGAAMFFFNKQKKEKREEYLAKAKALQSQQKAQMKAETEQSFTATRTTDPDSPKTPPKKITIAKPERKFVPPNGGSSFVSSGKMKITKREVKGGRLNSEEFKEALKGDKYAYMDLRELWPDTAIKDLYLSKECIKALGKFLKEENLDKAIAEMEGAIPEVGGFLMGNHYQNDETGEFSVTMDEFVPFVPEYHDVFKIEIGTQTLVQELGDAQDTHPDKDVIGWFHTHPGHGLFLSNSDLSVQRHFPQKFQIAMEIDSLTPTLDTAFFTRKQNGTINNVEHRKKGAKWFSWKKIESV